MTELKLASSNNIEMDKPREYHFSGVKKERKKKKKKQLKSARFCMQQHELRQADT